MKKIISSSLCALLTLCIFTSTAFADDLFRNTLNDQVTLTDAENFKTYTIGYTAACNSSSDWNLQLVEEATENGSVGYAYTGTVKAGSTLSAQINSAEEMGLGFYIVAFNKDGEELDRVEVGNENDSGGMVDGELTIPDDAASAGILFMAAPRENHYENFISFALTIELTIDGKEETPVAGTAENESGTPEPSGSSEQTSPTDGIAGSVEEALDDLAKKVRNTVIIAGVAGIGVIAAIIAVIKGAAAKKAAAAGITAAAKATGKAAGKAAAKAAAEEASGVADAGTGAAEDSYVVTDPATGAQTLYIKDQTTGEWVSSDGSSVLDTDKLPDWQNQRAADRAWQNEANEGVKKPTKFEDIDRKQALEEEQIHRESYREKVAIQHGMDASDMDAVFEKVSHDQARAEVDAQKWTEIAEHNDTGLKIAENLKTTADYSVSALGAVTGPAGTVVKDIYAAGTTIGGDVSQAIADGKDALDVMQVGAGAVTKSAVSVIQNHATGVVGKSAADIAGSAVSGGIDAYVKGENVGQGIAKGTASGIASAMVDTGGEMLGALKDGSSLGNATKDFVSSVSDTAGDFVKNETSDAINESFDKTFDELKPKKQKR